MIYYKELKKELERLHGKRAGLALLAAALTLLLSGCFVKTVDELYTLPRHSDEYDRLELAIDAVLSGQSAVYSAPVSGPNQQSVQLADLDGDGQEEAIAFLKAAGDRPLRACIFSRVDGDYHLTDVIEGDGTSFASVEYVQLTGQPGIELVETIHDMFLNYPDIETQIIAASVRNPIHVTDCALAGADIATVPYKVIEQMLHHPLTDAGIEKFKADYTKVFGVNG